MGDGGGWWCVMVVGGGWWWMVVMGVGWWMVVVVFGGGGSWWCVMVVVGGFSCDPHFHYGSKESNFIQFEGIYRLFSAVERFERFLQLLWFNKFFLSKFERFWVDRFFSLSLRDFLNYVFRDSINKSLNRVFRELFHFATCAICNMWNLEQVQFGTHAICNTCKL